MKLYCIVCRGSIPEKRQIRAATTCSPECLKEFRRQYRLLRNERKCRTCGRPKRKYRQKSPGNNVPALTPDLFTIAYPEVEE